MVVFSFRDKELPLAKDLRLSLQSVYGIGFSRASWLAERFGLSYPFISSALNSYFISNLLGFLNYILRSETKIRRTIDIKIRLLMELGHWRGRRHFAHLPTRGQRSRTNGRTQKRISYVPKISSDNPNDF